MKLVGPMNVRLGNRLYLAGEVIEVADKKLIAQLKTRGFNAPPKPPSKAKAKPAGGAASKE